MRYYFVGAGGIGMASLLRYFLYNHNDVAGYDRTPSLLTDRLQEEGAQIVFDDDPELIPLPYRDPKDTLVVYTPAVPESNRILTYFRTHGFEVIKRAQLLGRITRSTDSICVAGSHGKTTTSSMIAWTLSESHLECNAFLGGIMRNTDNNLILSPTSRISVIEADEYDRSFHHLSPAIAVITSTDPDHLDIYGDEAHYLEAFSIFTSKIRPGGTLILHSGLKMKPDTDPSVTIYTYSGRPEQVESMRADDALPDFYADSIRYEDAHLFFDLVTPSGRITNLQLGVPVEINVDNAVAAAAASLTAGCSEEELRHGLKTFRGVARRFDFWLRDDDPSHTVLLDDYAHSPNEVRASIASVRKLYPGRRLTVIFQPHLYTRTRDFAPEFAEALSQADEVIMPEIYPARELPIPGVDSELILKDVKSQKKSFCPRKDLLTLIKSSNFDILMTLGAADIDRLLPDIKEILTRKEA